MNDAMYRRQMAAITREKQNNKRLQAAIEDIRDLQEHDDLEARKINVYHIQESVLRRLVKSSANNANTREVLEEIENILAHVPSERRLP